MSFGINNSFLFSLFSSTSEMILSCLGLWRLPLPLDLIYPPTLFSLVYLEDPPSVNVAVCLLLLPSAIVSLLLCFSLLSFVVSSIFFNYSMVNLSFEGSVSIRIPKSATIPPNMPTNMKLSRQP